MKTSLTKMTLACVVLLVGASPVWAAWLEDFEAYSEGPLDEAGDWYLGGGPGGNNQVIKAGPGVNTTQTAGWNVSDGYSYYFRDLPSVVYTAADTEIIYSAKIYGAGDTLKVGFETDVAVWGPALVLGREYAHAIWSGPWGTIIGPDDLEADHWYEHRWTVDWSVAGGEGDASIRDLTTGGTWTDVATAQNVALGFTGPTYDFRGMFHMDFSTGQGADDLYMGVNRKPANSTMFSWRQDSSGSWHVPQNWTGAGVPNENNHTVVFGDITTSPRVVTTETDVTVRSIEFDHDVSYAITGFGTVNLESGSVGEGINAGIRVVQGDHQLQAAVNVNSTADVDIQNGASLEFINRLNLNGNQVTKTGDGSLIISNTLNTGGGTLINGGGVIGGGGNVGGNLINTGGSVAPGNSVGVLTVDGNFANQVPEPGTLALLVLALLGHAVYVCRRRRDA